jgi:hypothetical protein
MKSKKKKKKDTVRGRCDTHRLAGCRGRHADYDRLVVLVRKLKSQLRPKLSIYCDCERYVFQRARYGVMGVIGRIRPALYMLLGVDWGVTATAMITVLCQRS